MAKDYFIKVYQENEYQPAVEDIYDETLYFYDEYNHAAECLGSIIRMSDSFCQGAHDRFAERVLEYPNNIIAFCGDRGQGKTTAMKSFSEAIRKIEIDRGKAYKLFSHEVICKKYSVLNLIDPTMMADSDSIVKIILSRMMVETKRIWNQEYIDFDNGNVSSREMLKNELLECFQKCLHDILVRHKDVWKDVRDDELEALSESGDSSIARVNFYELVKKYLQYMTGNEDAVLIIQIDDVDLEIKKTHSVIEDIRKYLFVPRVVVLMSVNPSQLGRTIDQHFIEEYESTIKNCGDVGVRDCHEIAEKYIQKVLPAYRQIFLPNINNEITDSYRNLKLEYYKKISSRDNNVGFKDILRKDNAQVSFQEQIIEILCDRIGMILISPKEYLHNLVPCTMRELSHFLAYFHSMEKLNLEKNESIYDLMARVISQRNSFDKKPVSDKDLQVLGVWKDNLSMFEKYLIDIWAPSRLPHQGAKILKELRETAGQDKNRRILISLLRYYEYESQNGDIGRSQKSGTYEERFKKECLQRGVELPLEVLNPENEEVADPENNDKEKNKNVSEERNGSSYADVYEALNILTDLSGSKEYKFAYGIRMYYSIHFNMILLDMVLNEDERTYRESDRHLNRLNDHIGDVLYRKHPIVAAVGTDTKKTIAPDIPFTKFEIDSEKLLKLLKTVCSDGKSADNLSEGNISPHARDIIKKYCRNEVKKARGNTAVCLDDSLGEKNNRYDGKLYFNVFYPLMYEIDGVTTEREIVGSEIERLSASLMIMTNWDYQYELHKYIRDIQNVDGFLLAVIQDVYNSGILRKINNTLQETRYHISGTDIFEVPDWGMESSSPETNDKIMGNAFDNVIDELSDENTSREDEKEKHIEGEISHRNSITRSIVEEQRKAIHIIQMCNESLLVIALRGIHKNLNSMKTFLHEYNDVLEVKYDADENSASIIKIVSFEAKLEQISEFMNLLYKYGDIIGVQLIEGFSSYDSTCAREKHINLDGIKDIVDSYIKIIDACLKQFDNVGGV